MIGLILVGVIIFGGINIYQKVSFYKNLDATYEESFPDFSSIKVDLAGKDLLLHMKTDFSIDDAQGCVSFNMAFAAVQAGLKTTVLVDGSGTYLFKDLQLAKFDIPERMRKSLAAQSGMDLSIFPQTYKDLTDYLNDNGVEFIMNGTMNVVSGNRSRVYETYENYPYITPLSTLEVMERVMNAGHYLAY